MKPRSRRRHLLLDVGVLASAALAGAWVLASREPVDVTTGDGSPPRFEVRTWGVSRLYSFVVRSGDGEELWSFMTEAEPVEGFTYGVLPEGTMQVLPLDGARPRPLRADEEFEIHVAYQYRQWLTSGTSISSRGFRFRTADDGSAVRLAAVSRGGR